MMRMSSYRKGYLAERDLTNILKQYYQAYRVPLSGATQNFKGDIILHKDGKQYVCEVKIRRSSFRSIYQLITEYDLVGDSILITTLERWMFGKQLPTKQIKVPPQIKQWLVGKDLLFFRSNYKEWLVAYENYSAD